MAVGSFKLPISAAGGGGINYTVDVFTSSGTYTKPSDLDYCYVLMVSGGAGGGSGRRGAASTNRSGGYAHNGALCLSKFNNSDLTSTSSVTVGAEGTGGAARTTDSTNGIAGTSGGATDFKHGSTFRINGGVSVAGAAGVVTAALQNIGIVTSANRTKLLLASNRNYSFGTQSAADFGRGNGDSNFVDTNANSPFNTTSVGGQINSSNTQLSSGVLCGFYNDSGSLTNEITGTAPQATPVQPTSFYTFGEYLAKLFPWFDAADANYNVGRGGLGGGCGNTAGTIAGVAGAAALGYGAGGGGGGASTNGANSGAGGAGTGGIVIIINVLT